MKAFNYLFLIIFLMTQLLFAQFSKNLEITSYLDDNLYRSPDPVADLFTNVDVSLDYRPPSSTVNFLYNGSFYLYRDAKDRNFSLHSLNLSLYHSFGDEEQHTLYMGADGLLRIDTEDYNYYDYTQLYLYLNVRLDLNFIFLNSGYNFRIRDYRNFPELSNSRHYVYLQMNKSFETRTTLILESDLGLKSFAAEETVSSSGMGGNGRGMSQATYTTSLVNTSSSLSHLILLARIAQSVHEKLGLFIQYREQISLSDQFNFSNADSYYQDEEIFDDPFSYESQGWASQVTWLLPWSAKLQIGGEINSKNYISEPAYVSEADTIGLGGLRNDDQKLFYANLNKTFYFNEKWLNLLRINFYLNYIDNFSNSYWYNYKNMVIGAGIQWNF